MAHLFRDLSLSSSKRADQTPTNLPKSNSMPSTPSDPLPSPFGQLHHFTNLTAADLKLTAYDIFVAACRTSAGKPLTFVPSNPSPQLVPSSPQSSTSSLSHSPSSSTSSQRSLTSSAASKMKKALGLRSSSSSKTMNGVGSSPGSNGGRIKAGTIGELMRLQMHISEAADSRVRRGLLRISAGQVSFLLNSRGLGRM